MSLTYENVKNGSTSTGKTISDKLGFSDVLSVIQDSTREHSDEVKVSDSVSVEVLAGVSLSSSNKVISKVGKLSPFIT